MRPDISSLGPGDLVADRYRIEELVGQGGFGVVFRAIQVPIDRVVALKVVTPQTRADPKRVKRFYREAQIVQRLNHPNTVRLYDFGQTDSGIPFIAWEFLEGRPLDLALAEDGPFAPERVVRVASQITKSLMEAHGLGFVHRDIKPANVFVCDFAGEPDFVKVLDFGVAKSFSPETDLNTLHGLTATGQMLGTPHYTAPEIVLGQPATPAADVYALGLVMAELLTGRRVFDSPRKVDVYFQHVADAPVPLGPEVLSSPLGAVIDRATRKSPRERYATAAELLEALQSVSVGQARPVAPVPPRRSGSLVAPVASTTEETAVPFAETIDASWNPELETWGPPEAAPPHGTADPSTTEEVLRPIAPRPAPSPSPDSVEQVPIHHRVTVNEDMLGELHQAIRQESGTLPHVASSAVAVRSRPLEKTVQLDSVTAMRARPRTTTSPDAEPPPLVRKTVLEPPTEPGPAPTIVPPPRTGQDRPAAVSAPRPRREVPPTEPVPPQRPTPPEPRARRRALLLGLLLLAVAAGLIATLVVVWLWHGLIMAFLEGLMR